MAKARAELQVLGLASPGLVSSVEELLSQQVGVDYAHVNLGAAKVTVDFDDSLTGVEMLIAAMARAGYHATHEAAT